MLGQRSASLRSAVVQRLRSAGGCESLLRTPAQCRLLHCSAPQSAVHTHPPGNLLARHIPAPCHERYGTRSFGQASSATGKTTGDFYKAIAKLNSSLQVQGSCAAEDILAASTTLLRTLPHVRTLSVYQILVRACVSTPPPMDVELQAFLEEVLNELANRPPAVLAQAKSQVQLLWILHWCAKGMCTTPAFRRVVLDHLSAASCANRAGACTLAFGLTMLNVPSAELARRLLSVTAAEPASPGSQELLNVLQYAVLSGVAADECLAALAALVDDVDAFVADVAPLYNLLYRLIPLLGDAHPFTVRHVEQLRLSATRQESLELPPALAQALSRHVGDDACDGPFLLGGVQVQCVALVDAATSALLKRADWPAGAVVRGNDVDGAVLAAAGVRPVAVTLHRADSYLVMPRHCPNGHGVLATMSLRAQGYHVVPMMFKPGVSGSGGDPNSFVLVPELLLNYPSDVEPFAKWQDGDALLCG